MFDRFLLKHTWNHVVIVSKLISQKIKSNKILYALSNILPFPNLWPIVKYGTKNYCINSVPK